jgi:voltage-gated potassium channel
MRFRTADLNGSELVPRLAFVLSTVWRPGCNSCYASERTALYSHVRRRLRLQRVSSSTLVIPPRTNFLRAYIVSKAEFERDEDGSRLAFRLPFARDLDEALNSPAYELVLTGMVVTVSALYALETLPQLSVELRELFVRIEAVISGVFVIEYLLRFYSQGLDPRYLLRKAMLLDFISIFPFLIAQGLMNDAFELQFVRLLRVLRILRLERLVEEDTFRRFFLGRADAAYAEYKLRIAQIVFTLASIIWVTSGLIYDAEHGANPQFQTYFDALYFSIVSLTTVGLGDLAPRTPLGKLTISLAILVGVAIIPFQLGQLGRALFATEGGSEHGPDDPAAFFGRNARPVECQRCGQKRHSWDARYCRICGERLPKTVSNGANGSVATSSNDKPDKSPDTIRES